MKISPARVAAFEILMRIETERAYSSVLLSQYEEHLSPRDVGLCHEVALGALRNQIYLDRLADELTGGKKLDAAVRIALRIGLYQILFLTRTPSHAVVNDSVELALRAKKSSARSLVNAVLRRATRGVPVIKFADEIDQISVQTSHPSWLIERWTAEFGLEEAQALAAANNTKPRLAFRLVDDELRVPAHWNASDLVPNSYWVDRFDNQLRDLKDQGRIYFQDEASQLAASCINVPDGASFLDVCAAPGGKTGIVASNASRAALLAAGDLHTARVRHLRENLEKQNASKVNVLQYDAEMNLPFADASFDVLLADAPCTGTGTIRHNPEIRYFLSPADSADLSNKQHRILTNASKVLKAGGRLVYSTCSLERKENENVIARFLESQAGFRIIVPAVSERFLTGEGFARTWPHRDQTDGFFIAVLEKNGF